MLSVIISKLRKYKYKRYIESCKHNGMKVGGNTCIMPGCYFDDNYCSLISIGSNCTLSNDVFMLAHDASMYKYLKFAKVAKVTIHDNCFIGAKTIILPGVSIGPNSIVGAGSVVTKDVPPNSVAGGNPIKIIRSIDKYLNKHGFEFKTKGHTLLEELAKNNPDVSYVVKKEDRDKI